MIKKINLTLGLAILFCSCAFISKNSREKNTSRIAVPMSTLKGDTTKKPSKPKPYAEIITAKAVTDEGLFKVHKVDEKYYFEIPDSLFERDILIVTRVAKAATESAFLAGDEIGETQVSFSKGPNNKVFLKELHYLYRSMDSSENGMHRAVQNSNLQPIIDAFDIAAYSPDSGGVVIDMTSRLNADNGLLFFDKAAKTFGFLVALDPERSYIIAVKSFPINLEISTLKTYTKASGIPAGTYQLNTSIVLLPKLPLKVRAYDKRVGYFYRQYADFDANPQRVEVPYVVTRWRMEPKPEDREKYQRGELVEPAKPIVYFIDPATPQKWIPYLIQGVNDWQKAFEKAGFKNAIYALPAPENDSTWSLYDATHNAIVYKASEVSNASGPHVGDPRSGEIIETHIHWYHNVMELIHDWYMVQAAMVDSNARKMQFDDRLMGQLIRFVSSHEVGHTLGLQHNFGASSTIPVENLRNKKWVEENGFCPSIMDYARFNYVAQPEDNISEKGIFPRIGVYDEWAIEWGYRWFPDFKSADEEKSFLNKWVIERTMKDKRLFFGSQADFGYDPRCQSEDLGDNAVLASTYGIKNLKKVMPQLREWTKTSGSDFENVTKMRKEVVKQYWRYLFHVLRNIGGMKYDPKTIEQNGNIHGFTSAELQKGSLKFLAEQLFTNAPEWLISFDKDTRTFPIVGGGDKYEIVALQDTILARLLSYRTIVPMSWFEMNEPQHAYTPREFLHDLRAGVWGELKGNKSIGYYRRYLQKSYISKLIRLLQAPPFDPVTRTDLATIVKLHARELYNAIAKSIPGYKDVFIKEHLINMKESLAQALDPNGKNLDFSEGLKKINGGNSDINFFLESKIKNVSIQLLWLGKCWDN